MATKFSDILRAMRDRQGLSQSDLAKKTGLQPSAISHFETGQRSPSFDNLRKLADALGVSIDHLLGREVEVDSDLAGPVAQKLFRNIKRMSSDDQETLAAMAELLAEKHAKRSGGKG